VTGHCGNWELLGPAFRSQQVQLSAIVRSFEESWLNDAASEFRSRLGTQVIRRGEGASARQLLRIFRGQGNLLVLIDHDIRASSVWVPFFGKLAHTAVGPAQMALRHSMIAIPAFCERQADGRHTVRFHPPLDLPDDETGATAMMSLAVEEQIRRVPAQWTWMHRRWRRRPEGEGVLRS
jgi:KDO2-lipid IV(A) lauroyltransferase